MPDQEFGPLVEADDLEHSFEQTLRQWLPTYLGAVQRDRERKNRPLPRLAYPASWRVEDDVRAVSERKLPAVVVMVTDTGDTSRQRDTYRAVYEVGVGVAVGGRDRDVRRRVAAAYAAAIRDVILQQRPAGVSSVDWTGTGREEATARRGSRYASDETRMTAVVTFDATVDQAASHVGRPRTPDAPITAEQPLPGPHPDAPSVTDPRVTPVPTLDPDLEA